jgi:predicted O-methyltransferase YrrM
MFPVAKSILAKTDRLVIQPEITPGDHNFSMFNDAGTEVEVSEFLYSLARMIKPSFVLETGTHIGVSSVFIAQALEDNSKGTITTFEIIPQHFNASQQLFGETNLLHRVNGILQDAQKFDTAGLAIDFLFLDSEPQLRFDEFIKFWPNVVPGGFIVVHDLHPSLGHSGQTHHGQYDWPYGDFRKKLGPYIKNHSVQTISFPTPRGLTLFQKTAPGFAVTDYLRGV